MYYENDVNKIMIKLKFEKDEKLAIITFMEKPLNLMDLNFIKELEAILNKIESQA